MIFVLQARGDDANHALVPGLGRDQDQGRVLGRRPRSLARRFQDHGLDRAALAVQVVQPAGDLFGLGGIVGGEQAGAETGLAHPAAGVDPGSEHEAQVIAARPAVDSGHVGERAEAGISPLRQHLEPLGDIDPIEPDERHDIADRAERHQIQPLQQVRLAPPLEPAALPQRPVERHQQQEDEAAGSRGSL